MKLYSVFIFSLFICIVISTNGFDYSSLIPVSKIQCLVQNGYSFAIPRGYCSNGSIDSNIRANLDNAWAGGMKNVDMYLFPCRSKDAATQVKELVDHVAGHKYGMIWIDVEEN